MWFHNEQHNRLSQAEDNSPISSSPTLEALYIRVRSWRLSEWPISHLGSTLRYDMGSEL